MPSFAPYALGSAPTLTHTAKILAPTMIIAMIDFVILPSC